MKNLMGICQMSHKHLMGALTLTAVTAASIRFCTENTKRKIFDVASIN